LWVSLTLTPVTLVAHYAFGIEGTPSFVLSAGALAPLAFLIGEATENVAEHTGAGIGGFLNASFGNAPELIIALFAVRSGLPSVVRGSLSGSVVSTALLVLGGAMVAGGDGRLDRRSLLLQIGMVISAALLFLVPSIPGWHGDPERHALYVLTLPVAAVLLASYLALTFFNLRRHAASPKAEPDDDAWSLKEGLVTLAVATVATAFVSEILVHSLDAFGHALGLSQFFVAAVIVAIVGNATEHGSAVLLAARGQLRLAAEISLASSAQVAGLLIPAVAILSWAIHPLALSFRPAEMMGIAGATLAAGLVLAPKRTSRAGGALLLAAYVAVGVAFYLVGDR
jgi:Ca2+:H+ antiporter